MRFPLFFLPGFVSSDECHHLRRLIDELAHPSRLLTGSSDYRTSSSADLNQINDATVLTIERRIALTVGVPPSYCEGLQGQRYRPGEYYREHCDAFHPETPEFERFVPERGQRTWTAMIYLNTPPAGGATKFPEIGVRVRPRPGMAVVWYNLTVDRRPHPLSKHSAEPVRVGSKYIVTAWFRERA
jgi:prolyl 4-hydroxylase